MFAGRTVITVLVHRRHVKTKSPDRPLLAETIRRVMNTRPRAESQRELAGLVNAALRQQDPAYSVTGTRVRKVGVDSGAVRLEIEYRESANTAVPEVCPVCGNAMAPVMNTTLDGGRTEVKRHCTVCPFTVGQQARVPGRYIFVRAAPREPTAEEVRLRRLRRAGSLLREASRLIGTALDGTTFPQRKEYAQEKIADILSNRQEAGSLPNLIADVRDEGNGDPAWTRPLVSPKNATRKDL